MAYVINLPSTFVSNIDLLDFLLESGLSHFRALFLCLLFAVLIHFAPYLCDMNQKMPIESDKSVNRPFLASLFHRAHN